MKNTLEQSIAVYAWLETDGVNPSTDVDIYRFEINTPSRIYAEILVPVCPAYLDAQGYCQSIVLYAQDQTG